MIQKFTLQRAFNMTSKKELKEMIESLREEIRGLRRDVTNLQAMVLTNSGKRTTPNIPQYTTTPMRFPSDFTITCSTDTSKNSDTKNITATNC